MLMIADQVKALPAQDLAPVVKSILGPTAELIDSLTVEPTGAVHADQRTEAILKVSGRANIKDARSTVEWSTVLKAVRINPEAAARGGPETELAFYKSGLLDDRTEGLRASRCYRWDERENDVIWLWLEDLSEMRQPPWSPAQHFAAARDLGRFNGFQPEKLDENTTWLNRGWGKFRLSFSRNAFADLPKAVDNPAVRKILPGALFDRALATEITVERLLKAMETLPSGFAHCDAHPRNLFPPEEDAGMHQTIAIDWARTGIDVLGFDGGTSAGSALTWGIDEAMQTVQIETEIFANYLQGLRDVAWGGNEPTVRLGYLCSFLAYGIGCMAKGVEIQLALDNGEAIPMRDHFEARLERPIEEIPARLTEVFACCLPVIDEANQLLDDYLN